MDLTETQDIWVLTSEGAEITGYNIEHVRKLARDNWNLPEDERVIRVRSRANRYDLWLPDLLKYVEAKGHGPQRKRKNS